MCLCVRECACERGECVREKDRECVCVSVLKERERVCLCVRENVCMREKD